MLSSTSEYASTLDIGPRSLSPRLAHPQGEQIVREECIFPNLAWVGSS